MLKFFVQAGGFFSLNLWFIQRSFSRIHISGGQPSFLDIASRDRGERAWVS